MNPHSHTVIRELFPVVPCSACELFPDPPPFLLRKGVWGTVTRTRGIGVRWESNGNNSEVRG